MPAVLPDPFYYLRNFGLVLEWVRRHHDDLLSDVESAFLSGFQQLPEPSQALLARMVMRKGTWFRLDKLRYAEIGDPAAAVAPLLAQGWVCEQAPLTLVELFRLLNRAEIAGLFADAGLRRQDTKSAWYDALSARYGQTRAALSQWWPESDVRVVYLCVDALCERLRLLFFGNLRQDWSEFVLADLGVYRYEAVALQPADRAFATRAEVDAYLHLHRCRERLEAGEGPQTVWPEIPRQPYENPWLERRRGKLLMHVGAGYERCRDYAAAHDVYGAVHYPGARARAVRVLELAGRSAAALALAEEALLAPRDEAEAQQLRRMLPRLRRKAGHSALPRTQAQRPQSMELVACPTPEARPEPLAAALLSRDDAPVYYVENTLFNALFGLLFWDAIYAPVRGAFFHPFQSGPADLYTPDFAVRRQDALSEAYARLHDGTYVQAIRATYGRKFGVQSPFVAWGALDETLLEHALACIDARHLGAIFTRLLLDLRHNRAGFPDLIQFWPARRQYRLIEVKSPGDKLQDSQKRWLSAFGRHGIPAMVCQLRWQERRP